MEPAVIHEGSQKEWKVVYDRGGSVNILEGVLRFILEVDCNRVYFVWKFVKIVV